ncbi:hypothetical protein V2J09_002333 [Rumex salicifolius]
MVPVQIKTTSFQQNDYNSSGLSLSGSFNRAALGFLQDASYSGQSFDGSFRMSKSGFHPDDHLDESPSQSFGQSFRKPKSGVYKGVSEFQAPKKSAPISKRLYTTLKYCSRNLIDLELFTQGLEDWVLENSLGDSSNDNQLFNSPFQIDELRQLDFALEGVLFQQLFRMPCSFHASDDDLKEEEYSSLEDFLHTVADGLWHTFWHKNTPLPLFVSCACHPRSKFYTVEKAVSRGRLGDLSGAALLSNTVDDSRVRWDQVVQFALFKPDIMLGNKLGLSSTALCEALFFAFHILLSRKLSKHCITDDDFVYVLVLDSKFGGVIKFSGDLNKLEVSSDDPYTTVVEWIKSHAEISVSPVDRIWNKLGNVNWGDLGTLQLLLSTFYSMVQFYGPPRKSIAALASDHSLRLQKRRIECHAIENENGLIHSQHLHHHQHNTSQYRGEIAELENEDDHHLSQRSQGSHLNLQEGDVIQLDDQQHGSISLQIQDFLVEGRPYCYRAIILENPSQLLTLYIGAHPSRLEPSWEDMSLWYQVQRQTKVLNLFKQAGVSSQHLPQLVASGKILHDGPCQKQGPTERCDHPWCGTPVLVVSPVGDSLSSIVSQDGPLSCEETLRCCRDCLAALRSAKSANIQHGDISPENIIRVANADSDWFSYAIVSWGRAVLEERDGPSLNLLFSSSYSLQHGKLCPSSDVESLVYLLYFLSGGSMHQQDSIESALEWRQKSWSKRQIQRHLGEVSAILKAFADYVDSLCGTPYPVDYDGWLKRLDVAVNEWNERGKMIEQAAMSMRIVEDVVGSSSGVSERGGT